MRAVLENRWLDLAMAGLWVAIALLAETTLLAYLAGAGTMLALDRFASKTWWKD